jgi:hypothetical protein
LPPTTSLDPGSAVVASITDFRRRLDLVLAREAASLNPRHVVVLALDGVNVDMARACWRQADIQSLRSVWPTTTSAGWLSHLTGLSVAEHGVPGVVFRLDGELINVFDHPLPGLATSSRTIFHDAAGHGYRSLAVVGDMENYGGGWRDTLLGGAEPVYGHRFYMRTGGPYRRRPAAEIGSAVRAAVVDSLRYHGSAGPCLLWCYIEVDRHVHEYGYDRHTARVLTDLEEVAGALVDDGAVVLAHADHGLVPTRHDPDLAALLDDLRTRHGFEMGGAGRTRWLYPAPGTRDALAEDLARRLPDTVALEPADRAFGPVTASRARSRVGELVLVALAEAFLAPDSFRYEHGSRRAAEVETPLALWGRS